MRRKPWMPSLSSSRLTSTRKGWLRPRRLAAPQGAWLRRHNEFPEGTRPGRTRGSVVSEPPLMEIEESLIYGLWPKRLRIFEDRIETQEFVLLRETSESREYGWIDRVMVSGAGMFANLLIRGRWERPILMRGLDKDAAERAKVLIEERAARAGGDPTHRRRSSVSPGAARLIRKLGELRDAGVLTQEEFETKRAIAMEQEESR